MKAIKRLLYAACLLVTVFATGCIVTFEETAAIAEIEIDSPPPPPPSKIVVTRPTRPSRHHIWIGGHHIVHSGTWVWIHGHWARPPHTGAVWMPCHTRRKSEIWIWTPGYWR